MSKEIFKRVEQDIKDSDAYRKRQTQWYNMRHYGMRRKSRSADYQADLHFALIDTFITKWIPYYIQFFYARDVVAYFLREDGQNVGDCTELARSFDYKTKQKTNTEMMMYKMLSYMLMCGKGIVKSYWKPDSKTIGTFAVNPVYMIVPKGADSLKSADWKTQVLHFSEKQYKAVKGFNHDPALIKRIQGKGDSALTSFREAKDIREGVNCGSRDSEIVIWENYEETASGIKINWISPLMPEEPIAEWTWCPYDAGDPYNEFHFEEKEGGYYANRGIAEMLAVYEIQLCKCLNEMSDFGTTANRPMWKSATKLNVNTFKLQPNSVVDGDVSPIAMPQPGLGWNEQIAMFQQLAQDRVGLPNMALDSQNANGKIDNPTATQVNALMGMSQQMVDMRGRLFQLSLGNLFNLHWSMYLQFDKQGLLNYAWEGEVKTLDLALLDGIYQVRPSGSADNVNKSFVMQKAVGRKQLFSNSPWVNQIELDKTIMESDDPTLVKRLIVDPQDRQNNEAEEQSKETVIMLQGRSLPINHSDDNVAHLNDLIQFIQGILARPNPEERLIPGYAAMPIFEHGQMHLQAIQQSKDAGKQMKMIDQKSLGFVSGYLKHLGDQYMAQMQQQQAMAQQQSPIPMPAQLEGAA